MVYLGIDGDALHKFVDWHNAIVNPNGWRGQVLEAMLGNIAGARGKAELSFRTPKRFARVSAVGWLKERTPGVEAGRYKE